MLGTPPPTPAGKSTKQRQRADAIANGVFFKLGSSTLFTSWQLRQWSLYEDGNLCYYTMEDQNPTLKGKYVVLAAEVQDGAPGNIVKAVKKDRTGAEVALALTLPSDGARVLNVVFDTAGNATKFLLAISDLPGSKSGNARAFSEGKGWSTPPAPTPVPAPAPAPTPALVSAPAPVHTPASFVAEKSSVAGAAAAAEPSPPYVESEETAIPTASLGRVASVLWVLFVVYVALRPSPILVFFFSIATGGLVLLLRWAGPATLASSKKVKSE
jgi:hypothetical protein